jgi:hypothetical protein
MVDNNCCTFPGDPDDDGRCCTFLEILLSIILPPLVIFV